MRPINDRGATRPYADPAELQSCDKSPSKPPCGATPYRANQITRGIHHHVEIATATPKASTLRRALARTRSSPTSRMAAVMSAQVKTAICTCVEIAAPQTSPATTQRPRSAAPTDTRVNMIATSRG